MNKSKWFSPWAVEKKFLDMGVEVKYVPLIAKDKETARLFFNAFNVLNEETK